jgi:transcriptional regulator with XRE-family HTH domain
VIRRLREARRLRQADFGYTKAQVSAIERGKVWPSLRSFLLIAEGLGMSGSELLAMVEAEWASQTNAVRSRS